MEQFTNMFIMQMVIRIIFYTALLIGIIRHVKVKQYKREDYQKGLKIVALLIGIFLLICLTGGGNQNPNSLLDRIFKPIGSNGWMVNYGGLVVLIGIYYLLNKIYTLTSMSLLDETWKKVIAVLMLVYLLAPVREDMLRMYISWQKGVDSIYLDRDNIVLKTSEEEKDGQLIITFDGEVALENLSPIYREFSMQISVPRYYKDIIGEEWLEARGPYGDLYEVGAKTREKIEFEIVIKKDIKELKKNLGDAYEGMTGRSGRDSVFEIKLFDEEEAYFQGSYFDKMYHL